jgi:2-amino-4-hydroxy-6-hydroxymethyldihydropteridine diphosphokinase
LDDLILIGLGANLPSHAGPPERTLPAALDLLNARGVGILRCSRLWRSEPMPVSDQPWFVNAVAAIETTLPPADLLALLHEIEEQFGRERTGLNAARSLDIDLLAYGRLINTADPPVLPHPRLSDRAFVLFPLAEIASLWCHPESGEGLSGLIARLPPGQAVFPL